MKVYLVTFEWVFCTGLIISAKADLSPNRVNDSVLFNTYTKNVPLPGPYLLLSQSTFEIDLYGILYMQDRLSEPDTSILCHMRRQMANCYLPSTPTRPNTYSWLYFVYKLKASMFEAWDYYTVPPQKN